MYTLFKHESEIEPYRAETSAGEVNTGELIQRIRQREEPVEYKNTS